MSLAGTGYSCTLEEAVDRAWRKGAVLVAAAGNERSHVKNYPAAYENVIAVAATDQRDRKAGFSNHDHSWVDVAAPGVGILSTTEDGGYGRKCGTSMATPHVAGVAGLVWSNPAPGTSNEVVREKIESPTDGIGGTGTYWEKGRINACKGVDGACDRDRRDR